MRTIFSLLKVLTISRIHGNTSSAFSFLGAVRKEAPMIASYHTANRDGNLDHGSHMVAEQYANGLIHQEGQNIINYVTASQCIQ